MVSHATRLPLLLRGIAMILLTSMTAVKDVRPSVTAPELAVNLGIVKVLVTRWGYSDATMPQCALNAVTDACSRAMCLDVNMETRLNGVQTT